jgi:sulfotransferase
MSHELVLLSGLPRSGSTILTSLLNQHPKLKATTTSPVLGMVLNFYNNWEPQTTIQVDDKNEQQRKDMLKAMIMSAHSYFNKPIVIDKNRGWPKNSKLLTELFGKRPKMICTVRNIPDILASFVTLTNKDPNTFIDKQLKDSGFTVNNVNRCRLLWQTGVVGESWQAFKSGWNYNKASMLILEYEDIVANPLEVMKRIEKYLEIEHFEYDIYNLKPMTEIDENHGIKGLHDIRPVVKKTSKPPQEIIGYELTKYYTDMKLDFWHR